MSLEYQKEKRKRLVQKNLTSGNKICSDLVEKHKLTDSGSSANLKENHTQIHHTKTTENQRQIKKILRVTSEMTCREKTI